MIDLSPTQAASRITALLANAQRRTLQFHFSNLLVMQAVFRT